MADSDAAIQLAVPAPDLTPPIAKSVGFVENFADQTTR